MVDVCVRVGRRVRLLRIERGITQQMLADRTGLTQANISRLENGRAEPGLRVLDALARALGVRLGDLVGD